MVAYAQRLFARHRRRYLAYVEATLYGLVAAAAGLAMAPAALYLDLSLGEYFAAVPWIALCLSAAIRLGLWSCRSHLDPIRHWLRGAPIDPVLVWNRALSFDRIGPRRALWFTIPCGVLTLLPLMAFQVDGLGLLAYSGSLVLVSLVANQNLGVSTRDLMRPIIDEVAPLLPASEVPEVAHQRVGAVVGRTLLSAAFLAGLWAPAFVLGTAATSRHFAVAVAVAVVVSVTVAADAISRVARPLVSPIADLIRCAERVGRGDTSEAVVVRSADEFGELATAFNTMQQGLREREALRLAFGSYVDPLLAERLIASGTSIFEGETVEVTVLFADVRSFTAYSEDVQPREVVEFLNRLFDVIVPVVRQHGGHANHYLGDGLLAVFGAPQPLECHADSAVAAAQAIQRSVRDEFGQDVRVGIGINTGPVTAGTIGGGGRHEFTVIGDAVNTASRVEDLTKETGDAILITEACRRALSRPLPQSSPRGEFEVRGKSDGVTLHAVAP